MGKLMRWWKKRQGRDKYLKNKAKIGFISILMEKYLPKKYKGLFKLGLLTVLIHFGHEHGLFLQHTKVDQDLLMDKPFKR